ncbi:hypothetical protein ACFLUG_04385 [Chloroflexota bacterium]
MPITIEWLPVENIPEGSGDGIEVYYTNSDINLLLAFIVGFQWFHGTSEKVTIQVISSESVEFTKHDLDAPELIEEIKQLITPYINKRGIPPKKIGSNYTTLINS